MLINVECAMPDRAARSRSQYLDRVHIIYQPSPSLPLFRISIIALYSSGQKSVRAPMRVELVDLSPDPLVVVCCGQSDLTKEWMDRYIYRQRGLGGSILGLTKRK